MRKKIPIAVFSLILLLVPFLATYLLYGFMWSFEACTDSHSDARRVTDLSQDQLEALHDRFFELQKQYPGERLGSPSGIPVPDDLRFLKAVYIDLHSNDAFVVLAKCEPSEGVGLRIDFSESGQKQIELWWDAYPDRLSKIILPQ